MTLRSSSSRLSRSREEIYSAQGLEHLVHVGKVGRSLLYLAKHVGEPLHAGLENPGDGAIDGRTAEVR